MSRILRMKDGSSIDLLGAGVIAIIAITIAFLALQITPIVSLYKHPPKEAEGIRDEAESTRKYGEALAWDRDQVKGRSLFYIPTKPDEKPVEVVAKHYDGPTISMFVNGTAYFSDGQKVSAAEPNAKTLHFVRADPPWSVRVRWKGTEFDVPIFEKTQLSSLSSTLSGAFFGPGSSGKATTLTGQPAADKEGGPSDSSSAPATEAPPPPPPMVAGGGDAPPGGPGNGPPPAPPGEPAPAPSAPPSNGGGGSGGGGSGGGGGGTPPAAPPSPTPASPSGGSAPPPSDPPKDPAHSSSHV